MLRCVCVVFLHFCVSALKVYGYNAELAIICVSQECVCLWAMHRCVCERALMHVCLYRMLGRTFGKSDSMCYCVHRCTKMHIKSKHEMHR